MLAEAAYYLRMTAGLVQRMRSPVLDPEPAIRDQMANRESRFLETVRRVIYGNPANPFHEMLRLAGCAYEDLEAGVGKDGIESTMAKLHQAGVWLAHDELKCKKLIHRSGRHIPCDVESFLNPLVHGYWRGSSSGSRGKPLPGRQSPQAQAYRECHMQMVHREFGTRGRQVAIVRQILPVLNGINTSIRGSRMGLPIHRWYVPGFGGARALHYRSVTQVLIREARLLGAHVPSPEYLPENDFLPVARWIAENRGNVLFAGSVSMAVRVAGAALEKGLDIGGALFWVGGEALTDPKRAVIEQTGASVFPRYNSTDVGAVGYSCRQMKTGNCVHLFEEALAVHSYRRQAPYSDVEVNSLLFTTLLPFASRVLLNVEIDDAGLIEPASCDCVFSRLGFRRQVRNIFSYGKLTGQGTTLLGGDMLRLMEETLPARFGGRPGDFQLVEKEGARQTGITLRVSPRLRLSHPEDVREVFLKELTHFVGGTPSAAIWRHSQAVEVVMEEPLATRTGKVHALHLLFGESEAVR